MRKNIQAKTTATENFSFSFFFFVLVRIVWCSALLPLVSTKIIIIIIFVNNFLCSSVGFTCMRLSPSEHIIPESYMYNIPFTAAQLPLTKFCEFASVIALLVARGSARVRQVPQNSTYTHRLRSASRVLGFKIFPFLLCDVVAFAYPCAGSEPREANSPNIQHRQYLLVTCAKRKLK